MKLERVVIISDCTDLAFAEMRGAIIKSARNAGLDRDPWIDALAPVHHFSVLNAGFVLRMMAEAYPAGTLLMVVMNSIRDRTERIAGRLTNGLVFEGTNTGAFGWLLRDFEVAECVEIHDPGFVPFGGKFVHAPAVGRLLAGHSLGDIGLTMDPERIRRRVPKAGEIVHVDNFGNGKFLLNERFAAGDRIQVSIGATTFNAVYGHRMMNHADGSWVIYPGSSLDLHEIGEVRGNGIRQFNIKPGERIEVARQES